MNPPVRLRRRFLDPADILDYYNRGHPLRAHLQPWPADVLPGSDSDEDTAPAPVLPQDPVDSYEPDAWDEADRRYYSHGEEEPIYGRALPVPGYVVWAAHEHEEPDWETDVEFVGRLEIRVETRIETRIEVRRELRADEPVLQWAQVLFVLVGLLVLLSLACKILGAL